MTSVSVGLELYVVAHIIKQNTVKRLDNVDTSGKQLTNTDRLKRESIKCTLLSFLLSILTLKLFMY